MPTLHPPGYDLDQAVPASAAVPAQAVPEPAIAAAPAIDTSVLDALISDLGDAGPAMRPLLWESYLEDGTPLVARLCAAAARGDSEGVRSVAHQLKSSSALLGVLPLSALLQRAENAARAGSSSLVPEADAVAVEYRRVVAAIAILTASATPTATAFPVATAIPTATP